jgi:hypothetical protein
MTPKEAYEARRAERKARMSDTSFRVGSSSAEKEAELFDMLDRFVTAVERIADAMEAR